MNDSRDIDIPKIKAEAFDKIVILFKELDGIDTSITDVVTEINTIVEKAREDIREL